MRNVKRVVIAAVISAMVFTTVGCNMIQKTPEAIQKTVLAVVGDQKITMGDVDTELKANIDYLKEQYGEDYESKIDDATKEQLKSARQQALAALVQESVVIQMGEKLGYIPSDEELAADIQAEKDNFKEVYGGEEGLKNALEYYGFTDESFNEFVTNIVKVQKVRDAVTSDITVSDEDIQKYYDENIDQFTAQPGADVRHLLFEKEDEANATEAKIKNGETTFDALFTEYEPNKATGAYPIAENLGYVAYDQEGYDTDFLAGLKNLKDGEISAPVKSSFGYHIIEATNVKSESNVTPLDEVKEQIKSNLEYTKKDEAFQSKIAEWEKELNVKEYENRL